VIGGIASDDLSAVMASMAAAVDESLRIWS
jgi:hypothetical protein